MKYLGGSRNEVPTYASGISPVNAKETAKLALSMGHNSLKLKIGFNQDNDLENIRELSYLPRRSWKTSVGCKSVMDGGTS